MISQLISSWFSKLSPSNAIATQTNTTLSECRFVAIDLELTSLNPTTTAITSVGYVAGQNARLNLSSCGYCVVNTPEDLGQSPVIHGLTHDLVSQGVTLKHAMNALLPLLEGSILVFHNAALDLSALDRAFTALNLPDIEVVYVDTLKLAMYQLNKQHQVLPNNSATLGVCRQRLNLPAFPEHNALDDALATLTLLFAQLDQLGVTSGDTLNALSHTQALGRYKLGK
ncbi:3'-5' exonuclease [Alteromonas sp. KC3]|uniref:3'-5' exonuclease n=1 Tax=unclassified Alteromonas TaxID=2614992 RepID=UPI0019209D47|nr:MULTISPECIES: 3'-5' exonuclease [unclassified Alteromonas]BCO20500.1 3'-5' exonuclease [Alteromonas sp. KC3]BCO24466.1 3'-5' exonuclease [Alteromonas sp. KC14]